ncbi:MAG: pseudaminic acid biosynthesis-associated methylase [Reinekea sp.]
MTYKTDQENFWTSNFATGYMERNAHYAANIAARSKLFSEVLERTTGVESLTEFGANIGLNLLALKSVTPDSKLQAIEINPEACKALKEIPKIDVINKSILELAESDLDKADLTYTSGVLIHINPDELNRVYDILYQYSNRYIMVAEYYNPTPVMIPYHGQDNMLFKRDFAGDILDRFPDLKLLDYRFKYHRDNNFPLGDITWFLLEKNK